MRYRKWIERLGLWDGLLPLLVAFSGWFIAVALPQPRVVGEFASVIIPVIAFFARLSVGVRSMGQWRMHVVQKVLFVLGLFLLALLDTTLILFQQVPQAIGAGDREVWWILFAVYFLLMAIAMFPIRDGRETVSASH